MKVTNRKLIRNYYLLYTIVFSLTFSLAYCCYFIIGKTLIWHSDGINQHYTAFVYYGRYLREILRNLLLEHRFVFRSFDFTLGEGADVIQALSYYVIGDPFALIAVFFTAKNAYYGYELSIILRLYCSGAAFAFFCFEQKKKTYSAILAGAVCYAFCFWNLYNSCRHPFFINPTIWLPLIVCGVERILSGRKPYLYIAAVCLTAFSNFYFLYVLVLMTVIYVISRVIILYHKNVRSGIIMLLRIAGYSAISAAISAVLWLPALRFFLMDSRGTIKTVFDLFYPIKYYRILPALVLTPTTYSWVCLGYSGPAFLTLCLLFRRKGNRDMKWFLLLSLLFLLFPFFGCVFNGFSYSANRWSFAVAMMVSYSLVLFFDSLVNLGKKDFAFLFLCVSSVSLVSFALSYNRKSNLLIVPMVFLFAVLAFLLLVQYEKERWAIPLAVYKRFILCAVILSVILNNYLFASKLGRNYAKEMLTQTSVEQYRDEETTALLNAMETNQSDGGFFRVCGPDSTYNQGTLTGLPYVNYYWTNSSPYEADFWNELQLSEYLPYLRRSYNYRYILLTLSSVRYLSSKTETEFNPGGFFTVSKQDGSNAEKVSADSKSAEWLVYENKHPLPLGYCYDSAISIDEWKKNNPLEKQEIMLQDVVLDSPPFGYRNDGTLSSIQIPYTIANTDNSISIQEGSVLVTKAGAVLRLTFDAQKKGELYLHTAGIRYEGYTKYDLYTDDERFDPENLFGREEWEQLRLREKVQILRTKMEDILPDMIALKFSRGGKTAPGLTIYTRAFNQYNGREDFLNYLGPSDEVESVEISFSLPGLYCFDRLDLYYQPTEAYRTQIEALKQSQFENVRIDMNDVSGIVRLAAPRILCLSIPWSEGWTATVDGKEAELMRANIRHMAISLDAGEHEIGLHYQTPLLREGSMISLVGLFALGVYAVWDKRREKDNL